MSGIINESTSVIQVYTPSVIYLSSTTIPGQLVTVLDATGVLSYPQFITISTVGSVVAPPMRIQQGFGYITLLSQDSQTWVPVNCNSFPTPSSISYLAVDAPSVTTSSLRAYDLISSINVNTVGTDVRIQGVMNGNAYLSNVYVNNYQQYISTSVTDPRLANIGVFEQNGSIQGMGAMSIRRGISILGNVNVNRNISSKEGVIYLGGNLTTSANIRAQSGIDTRVQGLSSIGLGRFNLQANFNSSVAVAGSLSTNTLSTFYTIGNQYTITSSLLFGQNTASIQYTPSRLVLNTPITVPSISTNTVESGSTTTSSILVHNFGGMESFETLSLSSATVLNPNGSLSVSSITAKGIRLSTDLRPSHIDIQTDVRTNTIQTATPNSYLSTHTLLAGENTVSSLSTIGTYALTSSLTSANDYLQNFIASDVLVTSSILFTSAMLLSAKNVGMNNASGSLLTRYTETKDVIAGRCVADVFSSPVDIRFQGQANERMANVAVSTVSTVSLQTSSFTFTNALLGAQMAYSTINPSTPWLLASTFQMNQPPFTTQSGLGTYFNEVVFKSASDQTAYYSVINPATQEPTFLSTPYINTIAGTGQKGFSGDGGLAINAKIGNVIGQAAIDSRQTIYLGDNTIGWRLRQIPSTGVISTLAGKYQYFYGDGIYSPQSAVGPRLDVSLLGPGSVLVTDASNVRLRYVDENSLLRTLIGSGSVGNTNGSALAATLNSPQMAVTDTNSNVYIADMCNNVIRIYSQTASTLSRYAGTGVAGLAGDTGPALLARFAAPYGVAVDSSDYLYITDMSNCGVRVINAISGNINNYAGNYVNGFSGDGGPATAASLSYPRGIAIDGSNNVYICDTGNSRIRRIDNTTGIISTVAGNGTEGYSGNNGPGYLASLSSPTGVTVDGNGNLYIADTNNNCIRFLNINTCILTTTVGQPPRGGYQGNNTFAQFSLLSNPSQVVYDKSSAYMYIADSGNARIRLVDTTTNVIYDYVGNGSPPFFGNQTNISDAVFGSIECVASDLENNIYISDGAANLIRKIDISTLTISTVVGTGVGGYTGNGIGAFQQISTPKTLVADVQNNIVFCDTENHRVRKYISTTRQITTLAGTGDASDYGDGGLASLAALNYPKALALDSDGNIYIGDSSNYRIRRVDATTGIITTCAGIGVPGIITAGGSAVSTPIGYVNAITTDVNRNLYITDAATSGIWYIQGGLFEPFTNISTPAYLGDGGPVGAALLSTPTGVLADSSGNFIICDSENYRIRRTYTYGRAQNPVYLNMNMNFTNYYATSGNANIRINGNTVANFTNLTSSTTYSLSNTNIYDYPLQNSNPVLGDQTPYIEISQTGNTGYIKLDGTLSMNAFPGQNTFQNLVNSNAGLIMNSGYMRFPYANNAITIQNERNDASTRSLFYTGSLNNASDPALKECIQPADLSRCYATLSSLPLRTYNYIPEFESTFKTRDRTRLGFLTTEVSEHFPKSITNVDLWGSSIQTLDTTQIKYAHLGATQRLLQEVSTLEAAVSELLLRRKPTQRNVNL